MVTSLRPRRRDIGPLEEYRSGFRDFLRGLGYAAGPVQMHLGLFSNLSRWLADRGLTAVDLSEARAAEFFVERRAAGYTWQTTPRSLLPLLGYLRSIGAVGAEMPPSPVTEVDRLVESYRRHLEHERGLAPGSIELYLREVHRLAGTWWPTGEVAMSVLTPAEVIAVVRRETARLNHPGAKTFLCALRSFLRFLHATGCTEQPLVETVPSLVDRRRGVIPRGVSTEVVDRLVATCDPATAIGRRDRAMVLILTRLGLRAGEVAGLRLDDIDWAAGELSVRSKGRRLERLPLPDAVGEAIAAYLIDGRPASSSRSLFLAAAAPHRPLGRGGVGDVVRRCCTDVGVEPFGPHRLRHTVATETLRAGGGLAEVAQLLRHRHLETTAIYAKVDRDRLAQLARPWPGKAGR